MKSRVYCIFLFALLLCACSNSSGDRSLMETQEEFKSQKNEDKWTVDRATAEELKGMKNTMENFTLLNKKKLENLKAYQEYGLLLQNHIDRVNTYCLLDKESKNMLCKKLDKMREGIKTLEGTDMEESRVTVAELNRIFAEIDSSFNYTN